MTALAVLDVGKTNTKLLAFSDDGRILSQVRRPQTTAMAGAIKVLDVEGIAAWLDAALPAMRREHDISGLMVTTHGCAVALLAADLTPAAPILDYEHAMPAEVTAAYAKIAPPFSETYSPDLPGGLNFARTILFQEWVDPGLRDRARHIVTYPQYWSLRLSGWQADALASEISFLGCHSHMWNPRAGDFSSLAADQGWAAKFPPLRPAGARLSERDGLMIHNGVHDSNAALFYYRSLGFSDFTLISTGTWVIIFNPKCPLQNLDPARDMLANVTVDGDPVATIRFMGGREYDVISGPSHAIVTKEAVAAVIARGQMAEPSFAAGGPFPGAPGRLVGPQPETDIERAAIATLYVAAMMATSLDLVQSTNDIILDGGLAHNTALCATLAALRPAQPLYRNIDAAGTAKGAAALAFRELGLKHVFSLDVERVEPWDLPGLAAYYASWSANAEAGAYGSFV